MNRRANIVHKCFGYLKANLLIFVMVSMSALALKVDYVGSINDSLRAPTALAVGDEYIAVLEPLGKQIKIYTSDGIIHATINIEGDASGLLRLTDQTYLFCDKTKHKVIGINITEGSIFSYLPSTDRFVNPIEIRKNGEFIYVLDAGNSTIYTFSATTQLSSSFTIVDDQNKTINYASSFDYDKSSQKFYVLNQVKSEIWVLDAGGKFENKFLSFGANDGQLTRGGTVLSDQDGYIFISDRYQGRVLTFTTDGEFIGNIDLIDHGSGRLMIPIGMAIDSDRLLYVASNEGAEIHIFRLPAKTTVTQAYFTQQVIPADMETIDPRELKFAVEVEVVGDPKLVSGFDYEVFSGDGEEVIFSKSNIQPSELSNWDNGIIISEWKPEYEINENSTYRWRTRVRTGETVQEWTELRTFYTSKLLPEEFELKQNYPNPFNPQTKIVFDLPRQTNAVLTVYNVLGQQIKELVNSSLEAGTHFVIWDGTDNNNRPAASGIYFYRLVADDYSKSRKMILIR